MTAWCEAQQAFVFKPQPMTLVAYDIDCAKVIDLRRKETLSALGSSAQDLACAWEDQAARGETPATWLLVDRLIAMDAHAAIAFSQAPGSRDDASNLVLWRRNDECRIDAIDDFGRLTQ